jgi:uncharacterized protein (DUF1697 family)
VRTYVALLRGINVGGRTKIAMPDLRKLFGDLGAEDVTTYVQSGNVVFKSGAPPAGLAHSIEERIAEELGLRVTVVVRTAADLAKVVSANPFADRRAEPTKLHVVFLAEKPPAARVRALDATRGAPDEFRVVGREVYLHYPSGAGRSRITNAWFEKELGKAGTARNWRTVTKLAELAGA